MSEPLLTVRDLRIEAHFGATTRTIVDGLDLTLSRGEAVGIVGESGSGKSLTARALIGLLPRGVSASGTISLGGGNLLEQSERERRRVRGQRIALLLQDPFTMLNPLLPAGRQITATGPAAQAPRTARRSEAVRRLAEVGIADPGVADRRPFQLSGGMRQRVAIAAALASDPEILIADEPSTALDVTTQKEILALLRSLQEARGMGLVLITHDLRVAFSMCQRVHVLYAGAVLESGPATALERAPLHPYTLALLLSEPSIDHAVERLRVVEGSVPSPDDVATRCPFEPRCAWRAPVCLDGRPELRPVGPDRLSACVRLEEIRPALAEAHRAVQEHTAPVEPPAQGSALVAITGLRKEFRSSARSSGGVIVALDGVSIEIGPGESVGLVGESGSGKTTLARCLVGLETPSAGRIVVDGVDVTNPERLSAAERQTVRRAVQMVFQDPYSSLNPARTVGAALREALTVAASSSGDARSVESLLERVGLPGDYARRKPVALSGGERQRVAIARALAVEPRLLVCDEPVSALDVTVQAQILNLFKSLRDELGIAYLFITHDLSVVRQVADRAYVLLNGHIVESGPVGRVLDHPVEAYTRALVESVPRSDAGWLATPET